MDTSTSTTTNRFRRIRRTTALAAVAVIGTVGMATPAFANSQTFYGATGDTQSAASSMISHVITVQPSATPMTGYDTQAVRYAVAYRDLDGDGQWHVTSWQPWTWVSQSSWQNCTFSAFTGCYQITAGGGTPLPSYSFYGYAGHRYDTWVTFSWFIPYQGWANSNFWSQVTSCSVTTGSYGTWVAGGLCTA